MKCTNCESKQTRVTVTSHREGYTIRYCRCLDCKHKFKTEERAVKYDDIQRRNAKLNETKVREIRKIAAKAKQKGERVGETHKSLAIEYDVELSTIRAVLNHRTWVDVGVEYEPDVAESINRYSISTPTYEGVPDKDYVLK